MRDRTGMLPLVVRAIEREAPSIVSVRLEHPDGSPLPAWQPGAHVDVQLITRHERQYSLCGDPADAGAYRIAVHREARSRGASSYVHDFLRVGSRVHVRPPRNLFALDAAPTHLLLSAGIGITPILAMARHLAATGASWRMVHAVRRRADVPFTGELAELGDRVRVHASDEAGRLDLAAELAGIAPGTRVSACGPAGFVDALLAHAPELPEGAAIHTERFAPKPVAHRPNEPFTVVCARSGTRVEVPAESTMLQALEGAGVPVRGSCLRGVCGSCALQVLDGEPEHRDSLTTDDAARTVYACVSRSRTPTLVVDA